MFGSGLFACFMLVSSTAANDAASPQPAGDQNPGNPTAQRSLPRVRFGGVMVSAGYSHFPRGYPYYSPGFWGYGPAYYDPFLFLPYIHPGYFNGFSYAPYMGEVKLRTGEKTGWVYLDGALAGTVAKLRSMWLDPGTYELEVRDGDRRFEQKIYVLSGKTLKVTPAMLVPEVRP